jgi:hypothetical protein
VTATENVPASLDDYRWLVSDAAQPWLAQVRDELDIVGLSPRFLERLRKDLSADRAHLIVEQIELRERAREKFSLADSMYFTKKGLEQATDEVLANYKAARFPAEPCFDYCCGIGGDLLALGRRYSAGGLDRDGIVVFLANENSAVHALTSNQCMAYWADMFAEFPISLPSLPWHCDPDRRVDGRRTTQIEQFEPSLEDLDAQLRKNPNAAIKLAPATEAPLDWWPIAEREWLGSRGECRQQVAWFGSLARHPGKHAATVVAADGSARSIVGEPSEAIDVAAELGRYVYEPHAAVLAAHLIGAVCREHQLAAVSANVAYLTGDRPLHDPLLAGFEIREILPFDRKQLRGWCRQHAIGRLEIKKRNLKFDPAQLRTEIVAEGDNEATLIITPLEDHARVLVVERI